MNKPGIFFFLDDGSILYREDDTRLKALPWYKRLWAKVSKRYRQKYVDIRPFTITSEIQ